METYQTFLEHFNKQVEAHHKGVTEASWMAQTTGDPEWAAKLSELGTKYSLLYSSKETYEKVQHYLATANGTEIEMRQLELLVHAMKGTQLPEEIIADLSKRSSELNLLFNTYIPKVDGKAYSANDIRNVVLILPVCHQFHRD